MKTLNTKIYEFVRCNLAVFVILFLASIFVGFATWGILISTPTNFLPLRIIETFIYGIITLFIIKKVFLNKVDDFFAYIYDTGIKIVSISSALAAVAITLTSLVLSSKLPSTFSFYGILISGTQTSSDLIKSSSNFIGLLEIIVIVYLFGFCQYLNMPNYIPIIKFLSLWMLIIAISIFLQNLVTVLGTLRLILYSSP